MTSTRLDAARTGTPREQLDLVRELAAAHSNWGRWGADDELGTLNLADARAVGRGAASVLDGRVFSLALPLGQDSPQNGTLGRFNPVHLMLRDGGDVVTGAMVDDFYDGRDRHMRGTDGLVILPLQAGTHWDALSHVMFEGRMYNDRPAAEVSSRGARRNAISRAAAHVVTRGVLLDLPRHLNDGRPLAPGHAVGADELRSCVRAQGCEVEEGDALLIRTGHLQRYRSAGAWSDYVAGPAPGLGLDSAHWLAERGVAAVAVDTWAAEVLPNETPAVMQPLHIVLVWSMGLLLGEMFALDELAEDCARDGRYTFLFSAPPLPFDGGVASPVNPVAVK
ncbi:cyclase family protein [Streptantibioticus parmotrematis]|uniref:cyclase family protein n=1 Tax=Streptantibioticus parmotrematis TaxID=2873249 RepID=UPI00340FC27E